MDIVRRLWLYIAILMIPVIMAGCSSPDKNRARGELENDRESDDSFYVYYVNRNETTTQAVAYEGERECAAVIDALSRTPEDVQLKRILGDMVTLKSWKLFEDQLILDFDGNYSDLTKSGEVLFRASVVRTMCQLADVRSVAFLVEGESLADSKGIPFGAMTEDTFVDAGREAASPYERTELVLYFSNRDGTALSAERQNVVYPSDVAIEKIIVEHLIQGPTDDSLRPTLSPDRSVKSVSVKEGICYVDLTEPLIDTSGAVNEEVSLYSIVNSLTEITSINRVQISIDGEIGRTFRGAIELGEPFERNLDIIAN